MKVDINETISAIDYAIEDIDEITKHAAGHQGNTHPVEMQYYKIQLELIRAGLQQIYENNKPILGKQEMQ